MLPHGVLKGLACSLLHPLSFAFKDLFIVITVLPAEVSVGSSSIQRFSETLNVICLGQVRMLKVYLFCEVQLYLQF